MQPRDRVILAGLPPIDAVVFDLSPDSGPCWAVVWEGQLLPMRFAWAEEASLHLRHLRFPELAHQRTEAA